MRQLLRFIYSGIVLLGATLSFASEAKPPIDPRVRAVEILVLEPEVVIQETDRTLFHGYPVTDRLTLTDPDDIWSIIHLLNREISPHEVNICLFRPEYGLVVRYKEKAVELVISYACSEIERTKDSVQDKLSLKTLATGKASKVVLDEFINDVHR